MRAWAVAVSGLVAVGCKAPRAGVVIDGALDAPADGAIDAPPQASRMVVGYLPSWMIDSGYTVSDIDFQAITHVAHFALQPHTDGSVVATGGTIPDPDLVSAIHDRGARALLVLGGGNANATAGFDAVVTEVGLRHTLVGNAVAQVTAGGYDGLDLDYEYPLDAAHRDGLSALVVELRDQLPATASLSIALPSGSWAGDWYDVTALAPLISWFSVMTYDDHGSWSSHSGHNSPLHMPAADLAFHGAVSVDHSRAYYLQRGVPADKLLIGIPLYGQRFDDATDIHQSRSTQQGGAVTYSQVAPLIGNGWTRHWDPEAEAPYLIHDSGLGVISYDDEQSIAAKCAYVTDQGVPGVIIWALGQDQVGATQSLLAAVRACR